MDILSTRHIKRQGLARGLWLEMHAHAVLQYAQSSSSHVVYLYLQLHDRIGRFRVLVLKVVLATSKSNYSRTPQPFWYESAYRSKIRCSLLALYMITPGEI